MRTRRFWRWTGATLAILILAAFFVAAGGWLWLRTSLPRLDGSITVAGIKHRVEIHRDGHGVPTIRAKSTLDAYFALGFVHAQDRLWQMESIRRLGAGRLAEVLGPRLLAIDRRMRTLGLYHMATATLDLLSADARGVVDAYTAGVNAYLTGHDGAWPLQFHVLGFRPEPWRPADSMVWSKLMATRLARNSRTEMLRARLMDRLTPKQIMALWPPYPDDAPITLAALAPDASGEASPTMPSAATAQVDWNIDAALDALARQPAPEAPPEASNSWVLAGKHTVSGAPILANDPHLRFAAPNIWYLARIETPEFTLTGATAPSVPFHILGHNGRIAWGLTNAGSDTEDLFIERPDPRDPGRYLTPAGSQPFTLRREVIRVRGAEPVIHVVRGTRHGPVLGGRAAAVLAGRLGGKELATENGDNGDVLAYASAALRPDDRTPEAFFRLARAADWSGFVAALKNFQGPHQNFVYGDVHGNIGFYSAGRVPVRKPGPHPVPGWLPGIGWTGAGDWIGFIPFTEMPHRLNPPSGRIVNANHRIAGNGYPHFLGRDWAPPYRARRIHQLLDATPRHSLDSVARIQMDVVSLAARDLLAPMLGEVLSLQGRQTQMTSRALGLLKQWDGVMDRRRPEPLIFSAWLRHANRLIYGDELGPDLYRYWGLRPLVVKAMLSTDRGWCDDISTTAAETCGQRLGAALDRALGDLSAAYGPNIEDWRWGDAHRAWFRPRVLSRVPYFGKYAEISIASSGSNFTVNRGTSRITDSRAPFRHIHGPGLRAIYDLGNLDRSKFITATGQSGNPLSNHYRDLNPRWRDGEYLTMGPVPQGGARHKLVLKPR